MITQNREAARPLKLLGIAMIPVFLLSVAGIFLDHRIVTGAPVWLKPAKFAISIAIYCLTLTWICSYLAPGVRFARALAWTVAISLFVEIVIIDLQAARGTTSHFNAATPFDAALFAIMGISILVLLLASVGVTVLLFRQRFQDPAWGWALRLGMLITVIGAGAGGLMLRPPAPIVDATHPAGAHTVGGPDGGPGIPGAGWSTQHGDLRIPHFFGLHGLQAVPLLTWLLTRRRRTERTRTRAAIIVAASYFGFIAILAWQALRGQSFITPDTVTIAALGIWLAVTAAAALTIQEA